MPFAESGTPQEWDAWLSEVMTDDTRLAFYQWIGHRAVVEAVADMQRELGNDPVPAENRYYSPGDVDAFLEGIDPNWDGGPYPSKLPG